jgi:hypothetical protein
MELCTCGTLKEAYSRPRDTMAMARLVSRLLEVARGMSFLHTNNVLHGKVLVHKCTSRRRCWYSL